MALYLAVKSLWNVDEIEQGNSMENKKLTMNRIRESLEAAEGTEKEKLLQEYGKDERKGVQKLVLQYRKKEEAFRREQERLETMAVFEKKYRAEGFSAICGIDEAGRGPLAGPVVAGAVILPEDCRILYLNDSKKVSEARREALYLEIQEKALACGIGIVSPKRIDEINILQATYEAMRQAIENMDISPELLLVDAVTIPDVQVKQVGIVKGDAKSISIAAASILAKVTRDRLMQQYEEMYPEYGFGSHKGYGTESHIAAIEKYGACPIHRRTFISKWI